ncbi:hypothetical protein THAOC_20615, partial [Thalassiosira oceanica]
LHFTRELPENYRELPDFLPFALSCGLPDRTASKITVNYGYRALPRDLPRVPKPLADMTRPLWQPPHGYGRGPGAAGAGTGGHRTQEAVRNGRTRGIGENDSDEGVEDPPLQHYQRWHSPAGTPPGPVPLPPRRLNNDGTNPDVLEPIAAIMEDVSSSHRKHGTAIAHKRSARLQCQQAGRGRLKPGVKTV